MITKHPLWYKRGFLIFAGLIAAIQFIRIDHLNPSVVRELKWDSPRTRAFASRACFDCHSNEVRWPWYSYIAPVSWLIAQDVKDARERLNFSEISADDRVGLLVKRIHSGEMPLPSYLALHPEARLSAAEKAEFIAGLRRSFDGSRLPAERGAGLGDEVGRSRAR